MLKLFFSFCIAVLSMILFQSVVAQNAYQLRSHEVTVSGTSNVQSWTAKVEKTTGSFRLHVEDGKLKELISGEVKMEASSIKGSEGRRMDTKIYEALDIQKHPFISFVLRSVNSVNESAGGYWINTSGVLTIAGVSRNISLGVAAKVLSNGHVEFVGNQKVKMSDHKVDPPTAMLGALKTGDEVNISFKVVLTPR